MHLELMVGSQGEQFDAENVQETGKEITLEDGKQNKAKKKNGEIGTRRMVWWVRTPAVLS